MLLPATLLQTMSPAIPVPSTALPWAAILAGLGAIYGLGVLRGRFDKHETNIERRVDLLEQSNAGRITRDELNARFEAMHQEQLATKGAVEQVLLLIKQFMRRDPS